MAIKYVSNHTRLAHNRWMHLLSEFKVTIVLDNLHWRILVLIHWSSVHDMVLIPSRNTSAACANCAGLSPSTGASLCYVGLTCGQISTSVHGASQGHREIAGKLSYPRHKRLTQLCVPIAPRAGTVHTGELCARCVWMDMRIFSQLVPCLHCLPSGAVNH